MAAACLALLPLTVVLIWRYTDGESLPGWFFGFLLLAGPGAALGVIGVGRVRVRVDDDAIRVAYGPWRWPTLVIGWERVVEVEAVAVRPREHGGWGLRFVPGRGWAEVLRAGEGLSISRHDQRPFVVTVDDAAAGARAAAEVLRQRRASAADPAG